LDIVNTGCLKDETFMDYLEDRLSERERSRVEEHLSECDACLEELVVARGVVRSGNLDQFDPVPKKVTERAIKTVKALEDRPVLAKFSKMLKHRFSEWTGSFSGLWTGYDLSLATVRGSKKIVSDDLIFIRKSFAGFDAEIEIEKIGPDKANIRVMVKEKGRKGPPIRISLFKKERELSSYLGNVSGVLFEDILFGHYILTFTRDGSKIGEYMFEIKESRHGRK
jgi:putative zinc finger protein